MFLYYELFSMVEERLSSWSKLISLIDGQKKACINDARLVLIYQSYRKKSLTASW